MVLNSAISAVLNGRHAVVHNGTRQDLLLGQMFSSTAMALAMIRTEPRESKKHDKSWWIGMNANTLVTGYSDAGAAGVRNAMTSCLPSSSSALNVSFKLAVGVGTIDCEKQSTKHCWF